MKRIITLAVVLSFCVTSAAMAADSLKNMFSQGTVSGEIKMLDFTRDFDGSTNTRNDSAIGGLLYYKTAPLYGISFGVAFATSNDILSDDDDTVYGILAKDSEGNHKSFSRMQEYYIQGKWFDTTIKYGAQEIHTPFMDKHDLRMVPRTYKGASVINKSVDNLTLQAYYITRSMGWSDTEFISLSEAVANEPGGVSSIEDDKNMIILGASYDLPTDAVKANVQAWYYTLDDIYNESYFKAPVSKNFGAFTIHVQPSVLYQKSQGDELAGDLDTHQYGLNAGIKAFGFDLTGFYAKTGDDNLLAPWGDEKAVIQQVLAADRAEEDATAVKLEYDFGKVGVKGLKAYVFYGSYDTPDSGSNASSDRTEMDYNIQYAFSGMLDGFGVRVRYAQIDYDDGEDYDDTRFYVTYKFSLEGK